MKYLHSHSQVYVDIGAEPSDKAVLTMTLAGPADGATTVDTMRKWDIAVRQIESSNQAKYVTSRLLGKMR